MGCATVREHKGAPTGASIGAATGAVARALLGKEGAMTEAAVKCGKRYLQGCDHHSGCQRKRLKRDNIRHQVKERQLQTTIRPSFFYGQ